MASVIGMSWHTLSSYLECSECSLFLLPDPKANSICKRMNRFWVFDIVGNMWLPTEECVDGLFFVADVESFAEDDVTSGTMM